MDLESGHLSILAWNRMLLICRVRLSLSMMLLLVSCDNSASTQPPLSPASTSLHPPLTSSCHGSPRLARPDFLQTGDPGPGHWPPTTLTDITHKQDNTPTPGQNFSTNQVNNNMWYLEKEMKWKTFVIVSRNLSAGRDPNHWKKIQTLGRNKRLFNTHAHVYIY